MDLNNNLIYRAKIKNEVFKFFESKEFMKDLEQTCDIYRQKYEALSNKSDPLLPFCHKVKINFQEICKSRGNLNIFN